VSSSVDVNDLPFVGEPVNATVNLDDSIKPNLYYSGDTSGGVNYTSSTQYQGAGVGVELYFKLDSNYTTGANWVFDSSGYKSGWTNQRIYAYVNGNSITSHITLGNQLGRTASSTLTVTPSAGISTDTWYRLLVNNQGQRHYIYLYDNSNNLVHSQSQLLTISSGSYTSSSYQFFLDDFTVGGNVSGSTFQGLINQFSISVPVNSLKSRVLYQKTTPTWAATNNFTNDATAADVLVFDSPFNSNHLVSTSVAANSVTATFSSNAITVILDTTNSQASVTDLVSLTTDVLTGVSSSVTFNNLSVNLSAPLTTVFSTSQVSDLVVDIDEIIPPSLSVSSQVSVGQVNVGVGTTLSSISTSSEINPVVIGVLLEKVEAEATLTSVVIGVSITGVNSSSEINTLEAVVSTLINGVSSPVSVNSVALVSNGLVTVDSVSSTTSTPNQLTVSTDEVANLTGVEAGTAVSFGGVESQEAILRKVTTPCQVGTLTINVGVTLPSANSTFNASDQVKGVINVSVQLSTLPLVTVSRGSITLSTDGFNFEEFKNAFERARTVYVSRAA